jgi:hypothetical protein
MFVRSRSHCHVGVPAQFGVVQPRSRHNVSRAVAKNCVRARGAHVARNARFGLRRCKMREIPRGIGRAPRPRMMRIQSFRDLLVWQKAMDLAVRCYGVSRRMPKDEQGVLGFQVRRCAVSMPSNIAEGKARQSTPLYTNHLWNRARLGSRARNAVGTRCAREGCE